MEENRTLGIEKVLPREEAGMHAVENQARKRLESGELAVSFNVFHWRGANIAAIAKECGFHWLFIDTEHNTMDLDTVAQICMAALPTGVAPFVRIPHHDYVRATRILDGGALGLIIPHVDTAEQAKEIVRHCKFRPVGHRSLAAPGPQLGFRAHPVEVAGPVLNRNTMIVCMVESPKAVENAELIAAVEGVDALLIGTNDLAAEMGIPDQLTNDRIFDAYRRVIDACHKHGKFPGMGGIYDPALMEKVIHMGIRFLQGGGDTAFLMSAARTRMEFLNSISL